MSLIQIINTLSDAAASVGTQVSDPIELMYWILYYSSLSM